MTLAGACAASTSNPPAVRVFLVESYYSGSHRAWADGWATSSAHDVTLITHAAEFWRWRMRGAAVTLAEGIRTEINAGGQPDAVVVSDMIDLAALLGLCRGVLAADVPVVLYMHENQLLYPLGPGQQPDEALSLVNWKSTVAADAVWFNSEFQRTGYFAALPKFLNHMPDQRHSHLIEQVANKSIVSPVGVSTLDLIEAERAARSGPPLILWNQRWDHDKNPEAVFRALGRMAEDGLDFFVALAGENQRVDPQEFDRARADLGERVVHVGHAGRSDYEQLLLRSDIVVSAAHHEFFGISMVEAIAAGAVPVLPDRLSYPEVVGRDWTSVLYADGDLRNRLVHVVENLDGVAAELVGLRRSMGRFDWSVVSPRYDAQLQDLLGAE